MAKGKKPQPKVETKAAPIVKVKRINKLTAAHNLRNEELFNTVKNNTSLTTTKQRRTYLVNELKVPKSRANDIAKRV